jgi:hypothetical protein
MSSATTYGCLGYNIHAMFAARRCASARIDSRDPMVDSVLIAGHAGTAAAMRGSAWEEGAGEARGRRSAARLPVAGTGARPIAGRPDGGGRQTAIGSAAPGGHDDQAEPSEAGAPLPAYLLIAKRDLHPERPVRYSPAESRSGEADERQDLGHPRPRLAGGCNQDCNQDRLEQHSRAETLRDRF